MIPGLAILSAAILAWPAAAQETVAAEPSAGASEESPRSLDPLEASSTDLDRFLWTRRPVVVFADTPADPRFQQQMELLGSRPEGLIERDVVVIVDTDPEARSAIRAALRPRGFVLVLIAKDGTVNQRKPFPWDAREIERVIDKWPLRQQEIRERIGSGG